MKKLFLQTSALIVLQGLTLCAQSLVGTWQGTLHAGKDLRIIFKVSTTDQDSLKALMYSIDQGTQALPAGSVSLQGPVVKIAVPGAAATFEGKLSVDRNSIEGNWTQGPASLPLNLVRAGTETAWTIPEPPPPPKKMRSDADPVFEVATIKPSRPDAPGQGLTLQGRRMITLNTPLSFLIAFAYGLHPKQIAGGPAWLESEKYDITAEPDEPGQPNEKQLKSMLRKLLVDRFSLVTHMDKKELSAYVIVVGKTGAKLTKSEGDPNGLPGLGFTGLGRLVARNSTVANFAGLMQTLVLDRPVVDQSGLAGRFDFTLNWTPEPAQFGGRGGQGSAVTDDAAAPPDLFTAMVQQLGLKLEATKTQVEMLVIDKLEKPSAN